MKVKPIRAPSVKDVFRFDKRILINRTGGCWEWFGHKVRGYGVFYLAPVTVYAHRFAWVANFGQIPDGLFVCHHCDNRACVNPDHLFLGTALDNNMDKIKKLRANMPKGESNPAAKLNSEKVLEIRRFVSIGRERCEIAGMFNVCKATIDRIHNRRIWKHI